MLSAAIKFDEMERDFWVWFKNNCPYAVSDITRRHEWLQEHRFPYAGQTWSRVASAYHMTSNRRAIGWTVTYTDDDGAKVRNATAGKSRD